MSDDRDVNAQNQQGDEGYVSDGFTPERRYPRHELSMLVQYRSDSFEDFQAEYATNISAGGMFVRTDEPRDVGEHLYFQFLLKGGVELIEGLGRVAWVRRPHGGPEGDLRVGMGVEFVSLDDASRERLELLLTAEVGSTG